jgi:hypothetical protein
MQFNQMFTKFLLLLIIILTACNKESVTETLPEKVISATSNKSDYISQGDVYETTYTLCQKSVCDANTPKRKITTWGKPREVGLIYLKQSYPESSTLQLSEKMPDKLDLEIGSKSPIFVIKSNGLLPPLKKPLATARFTPIVPFVGAMSSGGRSPNNKSAPVAIETGTINIISIEKVSPVKEEELVKSLSTKSKSKSLLLQRWDWSSPGGIQEKYYKEYENKPDIKPQQVDVIAWQEGQKTQIIPVKKW